ncbi:MULTISPECIES: ABC transporter permease subunit [Bacillus]|uniref:ABC transporter permease subunit n=1 Tax=Bacillus TaxID=1386 RepID=UPI00077A0EBA|nr:MULTISPECIES: ABC transporter permease subunit [Bacillus cereus group]KXY84455.1 ABC transporter permease [Bacillus cereus]MBG9937681.1 ABC transporter permease [Bacillus tropicus]MED2996901.1 ABC transporter permease [Bacillus tropicus]OTY55729.1 ABC transporter permease [Bacillus thuringiensis serovar graciosensis]
MKTFTVLLQKEFRESWRSFKFLWMPLLFIFLGISDPLTNYYMKDILNAVGNLPEGFSVTLPDYEPIDILKASTGQFQSIGLIVFVITAAGMINRERQIGTATLIYVRPISFIAFFMSKWTVASMLGMLSAILGYAGSMYYTSILYGSVKTMLFIQMVMSYCAWILFATAISLMFSAIFKTVLATTFTIIALPVAIMIDSLIGKYWSISPWKLADYSVQLMAEARNEYYLKTVMLTISLTVLAIILGILFTRKNSGTTKI